MRRVIKVSSKIAEKQENMVTQKSNEAKSLKEKEMFMTSHGCPPIWTMLGGLLKALYRVSYVELSQYWNQNFQGDNEEQEKLLEKWCIVC